MPDINRVDEKRFGLKRKVLKSAIAQGRGAEAIAKLNTLYCNIRNTWKETDDEIVSHWSETLSGRDYHVTLEELQQEAGMDASRYIRAYNICELLCGSNKRLHQVIILPGTSSIH